MLTIPKPKILHAESIVLFVYVYYLNAVTATVYLTQHSSCQTQTAFTDAASSLTLEPGPQTQQKKAQKNDRKQKMCIIGHTYSWMGVDRSLERGGGGGIITMITVVPASCYYASPDLVLNANKQLNQRHQVAP